MFNFNEQQDKKGFTLIETIVTVLIFTLSIGAAAGVVIHLYSVHDYTYQQAQAIKEARRGVRTMIKELRETEVAETGAYAIARAEDYKLVFYSNVDKDEAIEKVKYYLAGKRTSNYYQQCQTSSWGGQCSVEFNDFGDNVESAEIRVLINGDFSMSTEYAVIKADGHQLGTVCEAGCEDCSEEDWQGYKTFEVPREYLTDGSLNLEADSTSRVAKNFDCPDYSMKVKFELETVSENPGKEGHLIKKVYEPSGFPSEYATTADRTFIISKYVRNTPPIFHYYRENGKELPAPARKRDTKLVGIRLVVNVEENRLPQNYVLESNAQLRNLIQAGSLE